MPLYKRRPFPLLQKPKDLNPQEQVFQVRFTKEIFRDYGEYLNRINLYRQRVWTCNVTRKINLTYEEALVSEKWATEKVQQFPKELVVPVLRDVQFSMLTLKDLVNTIAAKLEEQLLEGSELYGRRNNRVYPCKIVKVLEEETKTQYEVAWLDKEKKVTGNAVLNGKDLIKKLPFSRGILKSFIRESTCRGVPWVLHDKLAQKHGISSEPPEALRNKFLLVDGCLLNNRKRKKREEQNNLEINNGEEILDIVSFENNFEKDGKLKEEPIKYPIDDLLVPPAGGDPVFLERPSPSTDFQVPMDCVGDLLMVWNFFSSFGRILHLSPFSLEYFENALSHKDSCPILIVESHSALIRFLLNAEGEYFKIIEKKRRKPKITLLTWTEYLCDFLEVLGISELSFCISTIRRGHYGLLDITAKLGIFRELVNQAFATEFFRLKLDEYIEEWQAHAATRREVEREAKKSKEDKGHFKVKAQKKEVSNGHVLESSQSNGVELVSHNYNVCNGDIPVKQNEQVILFRQKYKLGNRQINRTMEKIAKKSKADTDIEAHSMEDISGKRVQRLIRNDKEDVVNKRNKEQRKENLEREMEKRVICTSPLGKDRYHNRYWLFRRDWRIFIESSDSLQWGYYSTKEELDALMGSLNRKGERERALKDQLEKCYGEICSELQKRSKDESHRIAMEEAVVRRSTRVRAPPRENPALAFLKYVNKWKEV